MHAIHYTIRRIAAADLPTVRDGGPESTTHRPATDQELLNVGLHRLDGDLFSCVEQYRGPHSEAFEPHGYVSTGELLTHGHDRYRELPDAIKHRVLRARVTRGAETLLVPMAEVAATDTVHEHSLEPHRWSGERLPRSTP